MGLKSKTSSHQNLSSIFLKHVNFRVCCWNKTDIKRRIINAKDQAFLSTRNCSHGLILQNTKNLKARWLRNGKRCKRLNFEKINWRRKGEFHSNSSIGLSWNCFRYTSYNFVLHFYSWQITPEKWKSESSKCWNSRKLSLLKLVNSNQENYLKNITC